MKTEIVVLRDVGKGRVGGQCLKNVSKIIGSFESLSPICDSSFLLNDLVLTLNQTISFCQIYIWVENVSTSFFISFQNVSVCLHLMSGIMSTIKSKDRGIYKKYKIWNIFYTCTHITQNHHHKPHHYSHSWSPQSPPSQPL